MLHVNMAFQHLIDLSCLSIRRIRHFTAPLCLPGHDMCCMFRDWTNRPAISGAPQ